MAEKILKVAEVMQTPIHMVDGLSRVQDALVEMDRLGLSSLVIERRNADDEYGVVTVRDIAAKVVAANRSVTRTSVYEIMTKPALTVASDMNVKYAIRLLSRFNINRALVTKDDQLAGLVTLRDMVTGLAALTEPPKEGK